MLDYIHILNWYTVMSKLLNFKQIQMRNMNVISKKQNILFLWIGVLDKNKNKK